MKKIKRKMKMLNDFLEKEFEHEAEIAKNGWAVAKSTPMIFDEMAFKVAPRQVWRFDSKYGRYYYEFLDELKTMPRFAVDVTSSVASFKVLPMPEQLVEWNRKFRTKDEAQAEMKKAADYGTFIHILNQNFFINNTLNLETIPDLVKIFKEKAMLNYDNSFWADRAIKDLVAMRNWAKEFQFKPIAVELMLIGSEGYGTAVDAIGYVTIGTGANGKVLKKDIKDGTIQEVLAIFDWKTSKGFYKSHEIQLEACKRLVEENFPEFNDKIVKLYNVSPKGEKNLTCDMKDQTYAMKSISLEHLQENSEGLYEPVTTRFSEFDVYLAQYKASNPNFNKPRDIELIRGNITFNGDNELEIYSESPERIVIEKNKVNQIN